MPDDERTDRWCLVLCAHFALQVGVLVVVTLGYVTGVGVSDEVLTGAIATILLAMPVAAVAFGFDRRVCTARSEWTPSRAGFLLTLPTVFNVPVEALYLYRRHWHLGWP